MKKRKFCLVLLAALCLLCACTKQPAAPAPSAAAPGEAAAAVSDAGQTQEGGALAVLARGTKEGRYFAGQSETGTVLGYIDYREGVETPLCSQPSCTHDSEGCPAFFEVGISVLNPMTDGSTLFLLTVDNISGKSTVEAADRSGANRRTLVSSGVERYGYSLLATDDAFLYYTFFSMSDAESSDTINFARVSLEGGASEILFAYKYSEHNIIQFLGVNGREIVVRTADWEQPEAPVYGEDLTAEEIEALDAQYWAQLDGQTVENSVFLNSVDTGERRTLTAWTSPFGTTGRSCLWQNGTLYWCECERPGPVHWLNAAGESGEFSALQNIPSADGALFTVEALVRDRLLIDCYDPTADVTARYAVSLADGSASEVPLRYVGNASERPVCIVGEGEDDLFVLYEERAEQSVGVYADDGMPRNILTINHFYGMISWEDFLAGRAHYRPIETHYMRDMML